MQLDGTSFRVKPPPAAADVLHDHPGSARVRGGRAPRRARARPLEDNARSAAGWLYFLAALPRHRRPRGAPQCAWSGNLCVGGRERLVSLMLARRSIFDLSSF
jgi:hypothetical protein